MINKNKQNNYLPKINPQELCESLDLCSIRKKHDEVMVVVNHPDNHQEEIPLSQIANSDIYMWLPIQRVYASGHVFISDDMRKVFLVIVDKYNKQQPQFTWWSPLEEWLMDVIVNDHGVIKMNLMKIEDNAVLRARIRTWVEVTESYNEIPIVDWVMMQKSDSEGNKFRSLVLLTHFVVKSYKWDLWYNLTENVIDGKRYDIDTLSQNPSIAPNVILVTNKALEIISE